MNIIFESIGYIGSGLVVVSMLMTSVKKLRIVNTVGSLIFTAYALLIKSYPTAFMNACLIVINVINLIKLYRDENKFTVVECSSDESIVQLYLKNNIKDINRFYPDFRIQPKESLNAYLLCTSSQPIGIMICKILKNRTANLFLDYTVPSHRDFSAAQFLYSYLEKKLGIRKFVFKAKLGKEDPYLRKMNYIEENGKLVRISGKMDKQNDHQD